MLLWCVGFGLPTLAAAQQRFLNTDSVTKYAAIGLVELEPSSSMGVKRVIGTVKRSEAPLMQQTEKWEARCDNGYPNVLHNPDDPHGAFRLWYGCFTSGTKFATSEGSVSVTVPPPPTCAMRPQSRYAQRSPRQLTLGMRSGSHKRLVVC